MYGVAGRRRRSLLDHCYWLRSRTNTRGQWLQLMPRGACSRTTIHLVACINAPPPTSSLQIKVCVWAGLHGFCPGCVPWETCYKGWWHTVPTMGPGPVHNPDRIHNAMWVHMLHRLPPCTSGEGRYPNWSVSAAGWNGSQNMWHRC